MDKRTAKPASLTEIFGQPIAAYTRRQFIADGGLIDLSADETTAKLCREAGFRWPVGITSAAFAEAVTAGMKDGGEGQDVTGRLWDVLNVLRFTIRETKLGQRRLNFQVAVRFNGRRRLVRLASVAGPDDDAKPCLTIMLATED